MPHSPTLKYFLKFEIEIETDTASNLSYSASAFGSVIKLKIAIRVKPAAQEFSVRSGLPGIAPLVRPAELEVYVESGKNFPFVNEKPPSTYVRASVFHSKYGQEAIYFTFYELSVGVNK